MESVEYFMVAVAAYLGLMVNEAVMDIAARDEFRHDTAVLHKDRLKSLELRLLFSIYADSIAVFQVLSDILGQKFEILIEYRLRCNAELDAILILT